jgi:hypothetical protein
VTTEAIVDMVFESLSEEEWEILQGYYNTTKDMLCELENIEVPIPRLMKKDQALLELRWHFKETDGSDKPEPV